MLRILKIYSILFLLFLTGGNCAAFQQRILSGQVTDSTGRAVENVSVLLYPDGTGTYTDKNGFFSIVLKPGNGDAVLTFSHLGFIPDRKVIKRDGNYRLPAVILRNETRNLREVIVTSTASLTTTGPGLTKLPVKEFSLLPSPSGSFEILLKTMPGVVSNNELSSQYMVRGGSFDENLVYVNDIEIFRPFLIRSGQQEGLSFINPDLVSSVTFSAGGFGAGYGDRMSSVLDVKYKTPASFSGSVMTGLMLNSLHLEGTDNSGKLTWLVGGRYKSTGMMLRTLDSKGDYNPVFADIQSLVTLKTGPGSNLFLLASYASNTYNFIPQSRTSTFGTETEAFQLYVLFRGREKDKYTTINGAVGWEFNNRNPTKHKFILSSYFSGESETFDIRGYYRLDNLDKNTGSDNISDSLMNIGIGSFLTHARNTLRAGIYTFQYKGENLSGKIKSRWGTGIRKSSFIDRIREWRMEDSAGYSIPYNSDRLAVSRFLGAQNDLDTWSANAWFEISGTIPVKQYKLQLTAGERTTYNSFSSEILVSPRASARMNLSDKLSAWLSGGVYYQPPIYREMRYPDGTINDGIKSQRSIHIVAGASLDFEAWDRPFRLSGEFYNKVLSGIIPYFMDNVRIIYSGANEAEGYSRGFDLRLNGEFVENAESWISFSLMDSRMRIPGSSYGWFPSPGSQVISTNIFFQDWLPGKPSWRAHLILCFATGLPAISPFSSRYDLYHRLPAYRRVDLGITKVIINRGKSVEGNKPHSFPEELVAGLEVYNLLDINNTVSYYWIKTISNLDGQSRQYAIPDFLTGRSLNIRLMARF